MGQQISLIDQTIEDARQKLRDIVLVAYDSLDPGLKRELPITRSNTGELAVKFVRHEEAKTNAMFAGTHARGGANSFLWISEWGVIQATDLARSGNSDGRSAIGRRRNLCLRIHLARGSQRAFVELGQVRAGDAGGTEGAARLACGLLPVAGRAVLLRCDAAAAQRGDKAILCGQAGHQPGASIVVSTQAG